VHPPNLKPHLHLPCPILFQSPVTNSKKASLARAGPGQGTAAAPGFFGVSGSSSLE